MNRSREWRWSRSSWPGCTKITCSGTSCLRRNDEVTLKGIQLARAIGVTASIRQDAMHTSRRVAWALLPVNASQPQVSLSHRSKRNVAWLALSISYNLIPLSYENETQGKTLGRHIRLWPFSQLNRSGNFRSTQNDHESTHLFAGDVA